MALPVALDELWEGGMTPDYNSTNKFLPGLASSLK